MADKKVLVVDDDDSIRELLAQFLEIGEYQPITASGGEEGMRQLYEHDPDLVISDVLMPGMDGHEFCRLVRQASDIPIIMLSGQINLEQEEEKVQRLKLGIDAFLSKPVRMAEFLDTVESLLNQPAPGQAVG